jgi:deoxyribodipyrimidine photolyase-related protein
LIFEPAKVEFLSILLGKPKQTPAAIGLTEMKILRLILGDQLNKNHLWFREVSDDNIYVIMEIRPETDYVKHHIQKLLGVLGAMRHFAGEMKRAGHHIIYIQLNDPKNQQDFGKNLSKIIADLKIEKFEYQEPDEWRVDQVLKSFTGGLKIPFAMVSSEHFLTGRNFLQEFFGKRNYLMESFYRAIRKHHNILIECQKPVGGKWNYDIQNRKKYDGKTPLLPPLEFDNDVSDVFEDLKKSGVQWFGQGNPEKFPYPVNRDQSLQLLRYFVENLLPHFGKYQDAMTTDSWILFHSRLSFSLNTKMLHPLEVVNTAIDHWKNNQSLTGIEQLEGFVRQIIGWREYVRGIYWAKMPDYAGMNYFDHQNKLPDFYWTGNTKMNCMKHAIDQSLNKAYAHHIQRLMITGNFALLAQIHPDQVDNWYLGIYIDAFEWVEITNTRGMSQFADGGIMATKPYNSSANYINKMSDYCKSCHYDYKKRVGDNACPFNSLYWNFYDKHEARLRKNPRIGMVYRNLDRMEPNEKAAILEQAAYYLENPEKI